MEVIDWIGEDISPQKDGTIERYQITAGEGYSTPNDGAFVEGKKNILLSIIFYADAIFKILILFNFLVHYIGTYEGKQFEEKTVSFNLGEGSDVGVVDGVEKALEKFKKGEKSRLIIHPKHAFGSAGKPEWNIPPNAKVEYTVELKTFEKAKESWSLDTAERIEQARLFKEKGTNYFKAGKFELAIKMYKKVITFMSSEKGRFLY